MTSIVVAFKEWAVICRALADGRQALILRKGGIVEPDGDFRVEHDRFWLYPTYVHQMDSGIIEAYRPLLESVRAEAPSAGQVRLSHFAEVVEVHHLTSLEQTLSLTGLHAWSEETVTARFHYRSPGLFALVVRVHVAEKEVEIHETDAYKGCKSWVELGEGLSAGESRPVMDDVAFAYMHGEIVHRLR